MNLLNEYIKTKSTSFVRYILEQVIFLFFQMIPTIIGISLRGLVYRIIIKSNGLFGIEENVQICHSKQLRFGKNVYVGRNVFLGASGGGIFLDDNVTILDNCYLNAFNYHMESDAAIILHEKVVLSCGCVIHGHSGVEIGKDTIVGPHTVLVTGNHGEISAKTCYRDVGSSSDTPINIGQNVWIGTNVTVLPGITIGNNVVIGGGSVITQDIPAYTIFAGNPAKLIKKISD